jgi:tripartite-type tricarboxylate transporter receptor subunit TctC
MKKFALAFFLVAASLASAAAETWPARPVKMIVGFAAGGPTDLFARLIAQKLSEQTGKNFYIENVGGAGGNIGTARAAQSPPDGYTLLVTGGNITNNPYLYSHVPYDTLKDFDAVTLGGPGGKILSSRSSQLQSDAPTHLRGNRSSPR